MCAGLLSTLVSSLFKYLEFRFSRFLQYLFLSVWVSPHSHLFWYPPSFCTWCSVTPVTASAHTPSMHPSISKWRNSHDAAESFFPQFVETRFGSNDVLEHLSLVSCCYTLVCSLFGLTPWVYLQPQRADNRFLDIIL